MADRETIIETGDGGAAGIVAGLLVVALVVVGFFFSFGINQSGLADDRYRCSGSDGQCDARRAVIESGCERTKERSATAAALFVCATARRPDRRCRQCSRRRSLRAERSVRRSWRRPSRRRRDRCVSSVIDARSPSCSQATRTRCAGAGAEGRHRRPRGSACASSVLPMLRGEQVADRRVVDGPRARRWRARNRRRRQRRSRCRASSTRAARAVDCVPGMTCVEVGARSRRVSVDRRAGRPSGSRLSMATESSLTPQYSSSLRPEAMQREMVGVVVGRRLAAAFGRCGLVSQKAGCQLMARTYCARGGAGRRHRVGCGAASRAGRRSEAPTGWLLAGSPQPQRRTRRRPGRGDRAPG